MSVDISLEVSVMKHMGGRKRPPSLCKQRIKTSKQLAIQFHFYFNINSDCFTLYTVQHLSSNSFMGLNATALPNTSKIRYVACLTNITKSNFV